MLFHYNIYENLKEDFEVYGDVLDVGCGEQLKNISDFVDSPFQSLIAIDKIHLTNLVLNSIDISRVNGSALAEKLDFKKEDIFSFDYKPNHYSLIICTSVLHFYCDRIKHALISLFYKAAKKKGLIFLRLNHAGNCEDTNVDNSRMICDNIYQSLFRPDEIRYLVDKEEFIESMRGYNLLENYTLFGDKTITVVIKK